MKRNSELKEPGFPRSVARPISRFTSLPAELAEVVPSALRSGRVSAGGGRSGCIWSVLGSRDGGGGFRCRIAAPWGFPLPPLPHHYSQP